MIAYIGTEQAIYVIASTPNWRPARDSNPLRLALGNQRLPCNRGLVRILCRATPIGCQVVPVAWIEQAFPRYEGGVFPLYDTDVGAEGIEPSSTV